MKILKYLLLIGSILTLTPYATFAMENPDNSKNPTNEKSGFWQLVDNAKNAANKALFRTLEVVGEQDGPIKITIVQKLHPDMEAFLKNEMMKKSSLSSDDIANVVFEVQCNDNELVHSMEAGRRYEGFLTFVFTRKKPIYYIRIPRIDDLFYKVQTNSTETRYIEIPDSELSSNARRKKTLLLGCLKHEEGHIHQYKNEFFTNVYPLKTTCAAMFFGLRLKHAVPFCLALSCIQGGLDYQWEVLADAYAVRHIENSDRLREMSKFVKNFEPVLEDGISKALFVILTHYPPHESRAQLFLEAAEKLEKQAKDHN